MQITEQLSRQTYSKHCQIFKTENFANELMCECRCANRTQEKEAPHGNILDFFFVLDTIKTAF